MSLQGIPDRIQCVWSGHIGSEALRKISLQGLEKSQMDKVPELRIVICLEKKGNGFLTCLAREPLLAERLSWVFASISIGATVCTINCLRPQLYLNNVKVSYGVHFPRTPFQDSGARRDFQHHSLWGLPSHFLFTLGFPPTRLFSHSEVTPSHCLLSGPSLGFKSLMEAPVLEFEMTLRPSVIY